MKIPLYQVDAFTSHIFGGNPAAVCPLEDWLPDATMQAIARENNLAETAFFLPNDQGYHLRWFTPQVEIDLCGHATLATAHVIYQHLDGEKESLHFDTRSGPLRVSREGDKLSMDFPARPPSPLSMEEALAEALGVEVQYVGKSRDILVRLENEQTLRNLNPRLDLIAKLDCVGVIATARGEEGVDFVSRFFAPQVGVPEDPVTGSAHSTLIPYWGKELGKTEMFALQVSPRGGELWTRWEGERVSIKGEARTYLEGMISIDT